MGGRLIERGSLRGGMAAECVAPSCNAARRLPKRSAEKGRNIAQGRYRHREKEKVRLERVLELYLKLDALTRQALHE